MKKIYKKKNDKFKIVCIRKLFLLSIIFPVLTQATDINSKASKQELRVQLKQRDIVIEDLLKRVEALESKLQIKKKQPQKTHTDTDPSQKTKKTPPPPTKTAKTDTTDKPSAPGQFEVNEQAAQRALERTLAQSGALLLPLGYLDADVNFTYTRLEQDDLITVTNILTGEERLESGQVRNDIFEPSVAFRLGLPFESQLELSLPYQFKNQSEILLRGDFDRRESGSGLGDLRIGIAKTLLHQEGWIPDLIARITWNSDTGKEQDKDILLNGGIHRLSGSLTALMRQDPLAFFLGVNYGASFEESDGYKPGNNLGFTLSAQLAASSATSLTFTLSQSFIGKTKATFNNRVFSQTPNLDGSPRDPIIRNHIPGSSQNIGVISIGASSILTRYTFLNLTAGMGLTEDAPDYTIGLTISTRTNIGSYLGL